jgi:H+-transporting ATPase
MVTGDAKATAARRGAAIGFRGSGLVDDTPAADDIKAEDFAIFAGVLPEDKYRLVKALQGSGHIVGMCGDGANDAPALRQAQMGIAVSTATDVAKSAAGIVLTDPGLGGIVASVKEGRATFQRVFTYTLRSVVHKVVQVVFLAAGLIITGQAILTPMLMVLHDGHRRLPGHVVLDRQCSALADAQHLEDRPADDGRHRLGAFDLLFCVGCLTVGKFVLGSISRPCGR